MAVKPPRYPGLHVTLILFIYWTNLYTCLGLKKDPRSQFYGHAVIEPVIYTEAREKRDVSAVKAQNEEKFTISFLAYEKLFIIDLYMNKLLFPSHYFEKYHENGTYVVYNPLKENPSHCHYQGQIRGINSSFVVISTCSGLSGIVYDGSEMYYLEPDNTSNNSSHFLFRGSDLKPQNLKCGVSDSTNSIANAHVLDIFKRDKRSIVLQDPYKSNAKSRYVELIIVNDNKEFMEFKQDKKAVIERSKEIANIVNGLYAPLNIYIALVGVIVWSEDDEIKISADGDATLTNFLHYRRERLAQEHPNDNAQLITATTFDGGVVGKALKGPICTYQYSGGVSMDHSHVVGLVATTVAHELGHNFGMEHDTDECQCPDDKCIMAPSSSSTSPRHWSSCSLEYLDLAYAQGMDYCLKNRPVNITGPVCGNGFLEKGEECDCGIKEFCDNKCCNATSCTLFANASCAMGGCCDIETCQVKKIATVCRDSVSECDLPEYCNGESEFCPKDTFLRNGKECKNGKAYCYDGQCQSHMDQCKLLWGQTGKMSDQRCFEQNYKGNVNGNCGYNRLNQTYKPCRKEDIMCGMLHCTHLNERLEFGMESAAILARSYISVKGKTFTCRSAIVDLGLYNRDPGLAPNGAKCGEEKMCVSQKCVPVSSIKAGECLYKCNGNGVCNNKGNCHCDKGYAPPYCNSQGPGGSIDSGPASDSNNYLLVVGMYVVFLGFIIPLMLLSVAAMYYYRNRIKTWWSKKAHKANIKSRTNTTTQRRAHPPKFNFDRNSLRTLEISAPIQIPPPVSSIPPTTIPALPSPLGIASQDSNKFIPIRPAPPRPDFAPQRTPSLTAPSNYPKVTRTSSLRTSDSAVSRPLSSSSFRPSCPPPRPPPPKGESSMKLNLNTSIYEDIKKPATEHDCASNSNYYDDCQTLDFSDTPLAFVHTPDESQKQNINSDVPHNSQNIHSELSQCINKRDSRALGSCNSEVPSNKPAMHATGTGVNSVAALAKKFEKKDLYPKKDFVPNSSMKPPFKSRPLPPRPGHTEV